MLRPSDPILEEISHAASAVNRIRSLAEDERNEEAVAAIGAARLRLDEIERKLSQEITVVLTVEEAQALHNHVPGDALVRAQTKLHDAGAWTP